jgi:CheY-like chemotaxis protein
MDEDTLNQAFDPFFTTKFQDRSAGLGLSVVHRVVDSHNGFVDLVSHPNQGTCCDVYLPAIQPCSDDSPSPEPASAEAGGQVLVIEDEEMVASLLKTALESRGYDVKIASSPREGIEIVKSAEHPFHLAIVDYSMPQMTGDKCIAQLRQAYPDLKAILMTGYNLDEEELCTPDVLLIHKPFSIPTLLKAVRTIRTE